ncbi:MAG: adenylate/guanylate cyclase domain-containing protein [Gammaproteobacteria bacterium]|nr:adenylate/guanylate cyclase domain-containing protein [Gammaproteobacteria bacterium]
MRDPPSTPPRIIFILNIPYYNPSRRNVAFSLALLLALQLLIFTGLGVFRLYFDFDWQGDDADSGQFFSLKIRGGNSFNLFGPNELGRVFWISVVIATLLALLMPWFRLIGGSFLAAVAALATVYLYFDAGHDTPIPLEFAMLTLFVLFVLYVLLSYIVEVRDRKRFASLLSQYVPPELAQEYSRDPNAMGLRGEEREISVLFCDVVGFSAISEQLESTEVATWLNSFFSLASKIIVRHRGTIDKYMGDSVMAVWGAPARSTTHAFDALAAAMDIQNEIYELNERFREADLPEILVGVGVSTGLANVGTLGSEYRMDYTVVGDTVNVAQRLEAQTRKYGVPIVVSDKTVADLPDMLFRELDTVVVKGRKKPVTMYQPLGLVATADEKLVDQLELHRQAMAASKAGDWALAAKLFTALREEWGPANMYDLYLHGIEQASRTPKN